MGVRALNKEIARIFNEIADFLEIKGELSFKINAYRRAAQNIENFSKDISELYKEDKLHTIPGVGKELAEKIKQFIETGKVKKHEELKAEIPAGLLEIMKVPGVGPKKAKLFYEKLKIDSIDKLEEAALSHKLSTLPGIQKKTEENILKGIEFLKRSSGRIPLGKALPLSQRIIEYLLQKKVVERAEACGSIRRRKETIGDIDILGISPKPEKAMEAFTKMEIVKEVLAKGATKSSVIVEDNIQVDLRIVDKDSFGSALQYFTGSKEHNIKLRELAIKKGLKINEYGVFDVKTDKKIAGKDEEDVYKAIGLPWIPPEIREGGEEIELAIHGRLPELVELEDIKGDLHVHSKWSDGTASIEEIAIRAKEMGLKYILITDHTKGLGVAGGLDEEEISEQIKEIDSLNKKLKGVRILKGIEANIQNDGSLDVSDEVLKSLDMVIASIHHGFKNPPDVLTKRMVKAIENPCVEVIAHPTGRILGERDAYEIDIDEVMSACKKNGVALEINAYPLRLDLNDILSRRAMEKGIMLSIGTDAHQIDQMSYLTYGVYVARRAWLKKENLLNCMELDELMRYLKKKRGA
jgi:DNA polymerase (family 10)